MIEQYLLTALETAIATVDFFPIEAPESHPMPYVTYENVLTDEYKELNRWTDLYNDTIEFSVVAKTYLELKTITKALRDALKAIEQTNIGYYIQEISFDTNSPELNEPEINGKRKITQIRISYKEE